MRPVRFRRSCLGIVLSLGLAACGGAPEKPPALADGAQDKKEAAPAGGKPMAVASPGVEELEPLPTKIDSLLGLVPRDAVAVVNLPRPDKLLSAVDAATRKEIFEAALDKLAQEMPIDRAVTRDLVESFDGAVFFLNDASAGDRGQKDEPACLAARFSNGAPVEKVLATPIFEKQDGAHFTLAGGDKGAGVWISGANVLLGCTTQAALSASLRSGRKTTPSFESSPLSVPERANDIFVTADMARIDMKAKQEPGSRIFASLASGPKGLGLDVRVTMLGPDYPAVGSVVDGSRHEMLAKLPANAVGALSFSTTRAPGKTLAHFLHMLEKPLEDDMVEEASRSLETIGLSLSDLDAALGSDIAVGVYRDPKHKFSLDASSGGDPTDHAAILIAVGTRDEGAQKKIFSVFTDIEKKKTALPAIHKRKRAVVTNDSVTDDVEKGRIIRIESRKGAVLFAFGDKKFAMELLGKFGKEKDSLAANKPFAEARAQEKPKSHAVAFLDSGVLVGLLSDQKTFKASGTPSFLSLAFGPTDQGLELALSGNGATELIGLGASLGVFGVRRYLASSKTSEAKINVGVIARAAARKYESEWTSGAVRPGKPEAPQHVLCKSAKAVPAAVPKGVKYMPTDTDYSSGDEKSGWRCLLIAFDEPQYYQYEYRVGGDYKGPKRGGPDPGKDGFEASAEGDLDGDGKTSLFTRTGKIVKGEVKLDPEIFIADELE